jgi:hypothetical protein
MDAMGVLIDTNTNLAAENSSRRVREEKRLDRKSYKSPRRFSGRSISRKRYNGDDVFIFTLRFAFMLVLVDVQKLHGCLYTTGH